MHRKSVLFHNPSRLAPRIASSSPTILRSSTSIISRLAISSPRLSVPIRSSSRRTVPPNRDLRRVVGLVRVRDRGWAVEFGRRRHAVDAGLVAVLRRQVAQNVGNFFREQIQTLRVKARSDDQKVTKEGGVERNGGSRDKDNTTYPLNYI